MVSDNKSAAAECMILHELVCQKTNINDESVLHEQDDH